VPYLSAFFFTKGRYIKCIPFLLGRLLHAEIENVFELVPLPGVYCRPTLLDICSSGSREVTAYNDSVISVGLVVYLPYNETYVGDVMWIGAAVEVGDAKIWAGEISAVVINTTFSDMVGSCCSFSILLPSFAYICEGGSMRSGGDVCGSVCDSVCDKPCISVTAEAIYFKFGMLIEAVRALTKICKFSQMMSRARSRDLLFVLEFFGLDGDKWSRKNPKHSRR